MALGLGGGEGLALRHKRRGDNDDGDETKVTFFDRPTNVYAVWDVGLMEHTGLTITARTDELNRSGLTVPAGGRPVQWALEAVRMAREHSYQIPADHALGQAYVDANLPVLRLQLYRGGVRLAAFLNAIFDRAMPR